MEDSAVWKRRKFCSLSCANTRDDLTFSGYSIRARAHLKDSCEVCDRTHYLAAHHIDHDRTNNTAENIETLCASCHAKHHHGTLSRVDCPA